MRVLAIDQGTSATKALVVATAGRVVGAGGGARAPGVTARRRRRAGSRGALAIGGRRRHGRRWRAPGRAVDAVGLANQGETVLAWDRATGRPLLAGISWQDRRAAACATRLAGGCGRAPAALTGLAARSVLRRAQDAWLRGARHGATACGHHDRRLAAPPAVRRAS